MLQMKLYQISFIFLINKKKEKKQFCDEKKK